MNLLKANHTGQPPLQSPLQSLLPSWMDECISQSRRAGSQTAWPHACSCHMCRMPHAASAQTHTHTHTADSLARFMFNEMFGRFLENLHYTATTGPVAGSQACRCCLFPLLPLCTCPCPALSLKKCTKWRALSARQLVVPLSSFILPVEQGNRIFVAGKRDCQVFHCTGPLFLPYTAPLPLFCGSGGTHNA